MPGTVLSAVLRLAQAVLPPTGGGSQWDRRFAGSSGGGPRAARGRRAATGRSGGRGRRVAAAAPRGWTAEDRGARGAGPLEGAAAAASAGRGVALAGRRTRYKRRGARSRALSRWRRRRCCSSVWCARPRGALGSDLAGRGGVRPGRCVVPAAELQRAGQAGGLMGE